MMHFYNKPNFDANDTADKYYLHITFASMKNSLNIFTTLCLKKNVFMLYEKKTWNSSAHIFILNVLACFMKLGGFPTKIDLKSDSLFFNVKGRSIMAFEWFFLSHSHRYVMWEDTNNFPRGLSSNSLWGSSVRSIFKCMILGAWKLCYMEHDSCEI